jgi:cobalt/nickel transport system permease protein
VTLLAVALLTGGLVSWFASAAPDGLEWSLAKVAGKEVLAAPEGSIPARLTALQAKAALLPGYGFKGEETSKAGTSAAGIMGGLLTLGVVAGIVLLLRKKKR